VKNWFQSLLLKKLQIVLYIMAPQKALDAIGKALQVGLHSLPGVRVATWTIPTVINKWCFDCCQQLFGVLTTK
jgi:hypothetical protein